MKIRPFTRVSVLLFIVLLCHSVLLAEDIPLSKKGGVYELPVEINGVLTLNFVLDSGASEVLIPADVVLTLIRTGTIKDTDFLPGKTYVLADGSTVKSPRFILRSLKVGSRRIDNVHASIGTIISGLLLGQSALERLGTWGIDSQRKVLVIEVLPSSAGQPYPPQKRPKKAKKTPVEDERVAVGSYPPTREMQTELPSTLRNSIGMEFVLIPAGEFQMGSNDGGGDEKPVHTVRISRSFYLGKYEVTQRQWEAVMGNNPSASKGDTNRPVENVSWEDVQEFINRLNARERGTASYRLPTEAEWEYAARAASTTAYSFGNSAGELGRYAWCDGNAGWKAHPVGQLQPNAWGLYDMHGNVWEWVQDWYASYGLQESKICRYRLLSGSILIRECFIDPAGPQSGSYRGNRGGSWVDNARYCRSASRNSEAPGNRFGNIGFRLLRAAP